MIQTKDLTGIAILRLFVSFEHLIFEFVSIFDIRILSIAFAKIIPAGLRPNRGHLLPD
jgi:hypothetical protein